MIYKKSLSKKNKIMKKSADKICAHRKNKKAHKINKS